MANGPTSPLEFARNETYRIAEALAANDPSGNTIIHTEPIPDGERIIVQPSNGMPAIVIDVQERHHVVNPIDDPGAFYSGTTTRRPNQMGQWAPTERLRDTVSREDDRGEGGLVGNDPPYMVGERGPERFTDSGTGTIRYSGHQSAPYLGEAGDGGCGGTY